MDALIFDFDGVVVDSEPIHLDCFRRVLTPIGVELREKDYYEKYLGYDDHDCFAVILREHGKDAGESQIDEMIARKTRLVQEAMADSVRALPGAAELIGAASANGVPLAICSAALRDEIEFAARKIGVIEHFRVIVAAEDVHRSKPDPAGYNLALERLSEAVGRDLDAGRCVVCEDSPVGIAAAKAAGMKVLAVTTSHDPGALTQADAVVDSLADVSLRSLDELL